MIAVDAGVLIAYLDPHDARHAQAVEMLAAAAPPLLLHRLIAAEVLVAPAAHGVLDDVWAVLAGIGVVVDDPPVDPHRLADLCVRTGLRLPDCCVVAVAEAHACDVLTFDPTLIEAVRGWR